MARATPKRRNRTATAGARFASEVLAQNARAYRLIRGLLQDDVGARMSALGHEWSAGIVGFVERGDRTVTVDELAGLAMALDASVTDLLDPSGPAGSGGSDLDVGGDTDLGRVLPEPLATAWVRDWVRLGFVWTDERLTSFKVEPRGGEHAGEAIAAIAAYRQLTERNPR